MRKLSADLDSKKVILDLVRRYFLIEFRDILDLVRRYLFCMEFGLILDLVRR